jgi:hypothetical protein
MKTFSLYFQVTTFLACCLKGLSHEIFGPVFWTVLMYLGLNVNRLWFFNINDAPLILDNYLSFDVLQRPNIL